MGKKAIIKGPVGAPGPNEEHSVASSASATPMSLLVQAGKAPIDDRGLEGKATPLVQNSRKNKPTVAGRPGSGLDNHNATISDMTFWVGSMANVLLIEDDKETAHEIRAELVDRGYVVDWAADGVEGLDKARSGVAEVVVIDRMLPGMDGLTIVKALRDEGKCTPVLVLSALGAIDDRVRGLRAGGDDYLTKPFATVELIARIEALMRRPVESRDTVLRVGPLELDLMERGAKRGDRLIDLLPREFRLLEYMMRRKDQVLTRAMLLEEVWKYKFVPQTNLVDVHMGRLRHKVDERSEPPMIQVVRGVGFILRAPA
jgi:two-component system, OmpR family, response regulator